MKAEAFAMKQMKHFGGTDFASCKLTKFTFTTEVFIVDSLKCILQINILFMNRNSLLLSVYGLAFCFSLLVALSRAHSMILNVSSLFIIDFFSVLKFVFASIFIFYMSPLRTSFCPFI
jgi:hypothetical protein